MKYRIVVAVAALAGALAAQTTKTAIPRTREGHPDLQGIWTNATLTPLQRPAFLAGKSTLTEAEALDFVKKQNEELAKSDGASDSPIIAAAGSSGTGGYNVLFIDRGSQLATVDGQIRTSLIVDPPDGKFPPRVPRKPGAGGGRGGFGIADDVKNRPLSERCIVSFGSSSGPPMLPVLYNNNYQIVQTPNYVMILVEMVHDARIIRINGTHPPPTVYQWLGDSIGHWEGDTLVVDTTNIDPRNRFQGADHVVERFRRTDANTIVYRATIDDPAVFTKPYTLEFPFVATAGPIYEYACHEGNYAMTDILGGARKTEDGSGKK